jgi:glycosyltransferase involved in cell wall biosynthesis
MKKDLLDKYLENHDFNEYLPMSDIDNLTNYVNKQNVEDIPYVSIVIPVYNSAPYLRRCLDSISVQTLWNIEIICVNDGSTDDSQGILVEYAAKDKRIRIINFPGNQGVSAARNAGIAVAQGEYLGFVDSDDAVDGDFYEKLFIRAIATNSDIAKGELCHINNDKSHNFISNNDEIKRNKTYFTDFFYTAIYRASMIIDNKIIFPVGINQGEDRVFLISAVIVSNNVATVNGTNYCYFRRENSLNSRILDFGTVKLGVEACVMIVDFAGTFCNLFVNANDYAYIYYSQILAIINWLAPRNGSLPAKRICAEAMISIYNKCINKGPLDIYLENHEWKRYLPTSDIDSLTDYITRTRKMKIQFSSAILQKLRHKHANCN